MTDARKRQKLDHVRPKAVDEKKPVFLKLNFKKQASVVEEEEPDSKIEDDETYLKRPWQERSEDIPLLLAFRNQFHELFQGVPDIGPQDLEEGIYMPEPSDKVMEFVCCLLTLTMNRIKPVE